MGGFLFVLPLIVMIFVQPIQYYSFALFRKFPDLYRQFKELVGFKEHQPLDRLQAATEDFEEMPPLRSTNAPLQREAESSATSERERRWRERERERDKERKPGAFDTESTSTSDRKIHLEIGTNWFTFALSRVYKLS